MNKTDTSKFPDLVSVVSVSWDQRCALWRRCRPDSHCRAPCSCWGFFCVGWWRVGPSAAPAPVSSAWSAHSRWQQPWLKMSQLLRSSLRPAEHRLHKQSPVRARSPGGSQSHGRSYGWCQTPAGQISRISFLFQSENTWHESKLSSSKRKKNWGGRKWNA